MKKVWRFQPLFLFLICVAEFTGVYLKKHHQPNQWPYNILLLFQVLFINLMFASLFSRYIKSKPTIIIGCAVLAVIYTVEIFIHGFFRFNEVTYDTMSVIFIIYSLFYFYLLHKSDLYINLKYSSEFWWVCGILLFTFGSTGVNLFRGNLSILIANTNHYLTYYIYIVLNFILYTCWSYSFICRKWMTSKA